MTIEDFKSLDPECADGGCQSLAWKGRYKSAVQRRQDFRLAYRESRATITDLVEALEDLIECCEKQRAFTNPNNTMTTGGLRSARAALAKAKQS
jgi:hypothetical protein